MELSGGTGGGAQYVGVAFSPTGRMENSDFYYCSGTAFRSGVIVNRSPPTIDASLPVCTFLLLKIILVYALFLNYHK